MDDLPFETHILDGVNLLLLGTRCLVLAIDLLDMFVHRLFSPGPMRVNSFHALKSRVGNCIVLAMAISFLQAFGTTSAKKSSVKTPVAIISSPMLISAVSIAVVTLVLIAFGRWGGEQSSQR